jgi:hypothetical protein
VRYFLGIGAQRAGSTWLYKQLERHPEVALPQRKEVHFFDAMYGTRYGESAGVVLAQQFKALVRQGRQAAALQIAEQFEVLFKGPEEYKDYLGRGQDDRTCVIGDITPGYADLTVEGFSVAKSVLDPQVIFVMRDPLERYWSWVRTAGTGSKRLTKMFEKAIFEPMVWSRCDYPAVLKSLDDVFDPGKVLVLFHEQLFNTSALEEIAGFLGVSPTWAWDIERRWDEGPSHPMPEASPELIARFEPVYSYVRERFGTDVPDSWRS